LQIAGEGSWKTSPTGGYEIAISDKAGKPITLAASIDSDVLTMNKGGLSLVFNRAE
jgi:hypothetical protein